MNSPPWVFTPAGANDGERKGLNWGSGGGWNDVAPGNTFSDTLQIDFNGSKTIDEIDVFTCQDNYANPSEPTETMTFSIYGLTGFEVQYWNGSGWVMVPGGLVSGSNKVWKKISFSPITTSKIKVLTNASVDGYSRITELEAWGTEATSSTANINWLVTDQLGTPRMVVDQSGSLAGVKRHDYLPFGEEIGGPLVTLLGGRTTAQGYSGDSVRQHFTGYEADGETGLNFAEARYQSPTQGRFTSVDPLGASASVADPQSFNRYSYVNNNPTNLIDPSGMQAYDASNSYSEAADSLEAQPFNPNRSHFGGPAILYAAGLLQSISMSGSSGQSQGGSTQARQGAGKESCAALARRLREKQQNQPIETTEPQIITQITLRATTQTAQTPQEEGITIAQQRIPGCPVFKSGNGLSKFNEIVTNGGIVKSDISFFNLETRRQDSLVNHPDIFAVTDGTKMYLNPAGPLFNGTWKNYDFTRGLSEEEVFGLVYMHETAHGTGDFGPDLGMGSKSLGYSLQIRLRCFSDKPFR